MTTRIAALAGITAFAMMSSPALAADVSYTCTDGTHLTATFSPPAANLGTVVIVMAGSDTKTTLPQVTSADGGRYVRGDMEFWIKGQGATLTRGGRSTTCQSK